MTFKRLGAITAAATLVWVCGLPSLVSAQTTAGKWQVDLVGGLSKFDLPTGGTATLPPAGPPLTTDGPTAPSRSIPTWFLGDGASLLNGTNADWGVPARVTPVDQALGSLGLSGTNSAVVGVRIRRRFTNRLSLELSADLLPGSREVSPTLLSAADAAVASFEPAMAGLLATGPFTNVSISATRSAAGQSSREVATTAALQWTISHGAWSPYLTLGGGLVNQIGDLPSITLTGHYQATIVGEDLEEVPIDETDTLRISYDQGSALVGVAGVGIRGLLTNRLGLVADGRVLIGQQTLALTLNAEPMVATLTPADSISSSSTPAVQFSNNPSTGRQSSLSGSLKDFKAFSTSGVQVRYLITAGIFFRF